MTTSPRPLPPWLYGNFLPSILPIFRDDRARRQPFMTGGIISAHFCRAPLAFGMPPSGQYCV
jgi:hypothetical protein